MKFRTARGELERWQGNEEEGKLTMNERYIE